MVDNSLKVIGAGHLGVRAALLWKKKFPEASIYLKSRKNDEARANTWSKSGFKPLSQETESKDNPVKVRNIVYCAPLSNSQTYVDDIQQSFNSWLKDDGAFVFTSSAGIYAENSGGIVSEHSEVNRTSDRYKILLQAEEVVLANGGIVLRLGGLYTKTRGAHNYWLKNSSGVKEFTSCPNGLINLVHYDDAAQLVVNALSNASKDKLYLASDGVPISRKDICDASMKCPEYANASVPIFTGDSEKVDGKRYDTTLVRGSFDWLPKFTSFAEFMVSGYDKEINVDGLL